MKNMKTTISGLVASIVLLPFLANAQIEPIRNLFERLANSQAGEIPDPDAVSSLLNAAMPTVTSADLSLLVPAVRKCLVSENFAIRAEAGRFLIRLAISTPKRMNTADLIRPYEDIVISWLSSPSEKGEGKLTAMFLLGVAWPGPSTTTIAAFRAHLNDANNTADDFSAIASGILMYAKSEPTLIREVFAAARKWEPGKVSGGIIQDIGLIPITDNEALAYVRDGFSRPADRSTAIEAVGRMPEDVRGQFTKELYRVSVDPEEKPEIRSAAASVMRPR